MEKEILKELNNYFSYLYIAINDNYVYINKIKIEEIYVKNISFNTDQEELIRELKEKINNYLQKFFIKNKYNKAGV